MSIYFGKAKLTSIWDVVVVGGGHAGCEAALAAARMGCQTLLVTQSVLHLGTMPCNPSIGGLAKSHLIFELDALGGEMATNTDLTGFQFRVLNSSRGPAVRANRVQCDKEAYTQRMISTIVMQENLSCLQDECTGILRDSNDTMSPCKGISTKENGEIQSKTVVITSGTALKGVIYIGKEEQISGGGGRPGCNELSDNLKKNGFELTRLKTGTPPRLDVRSIHWEAFENQTSEYPIPTFSWTGKKLLKDPECSMWNKMQTDLGTAVQTGKTLECSSWNKSFTNSKSEEQVRQSTDCSSWNKTHSEFESSEQTEKQVECSMWNKMLMKNQKWNDEYQGKYEKIKSKQNGKLERTEIPIFLKGTNTLDDKSKSMAEKGCSTWNNLPCTEIKAHSKNAIVPWLPFSEQKIVSTGHTTEKTADIVRNHLKESALYGGPIHGTGVRYCPSFEDKIVKFTKKTEHHVILEPESRLSPAVYPNGLSNSLPRNIQVEMVHSVPGLEDARFLAWGYAIEYDAIDARELDHRLASKRIDRLFFAGQTNGTTGYEEAAAQGIMAGINAALRSKEEDGVVLGRSEAYIGVMIDDLVTKGTDEPYRMFTSRAERRLHLRQDNARFRLYEKSKRIGLANPDFLEETNRIMTEYQNEIIRLNHGGRDAAGSGAWGRKMMHPGVKYSEMPFSVDTLSEDAIEQIEFYYHYAGYLKQEEFQIQKMKKNETLKIPHDLDYFSIEALRYESRERLSRVRPETLAQASRIPGVNPADISVLAIVIHKLQTGCK